MTYRARVSKMVQSAGFLYVLSQLIASYCDWTNDERMCEMFRVNSKRILTFTDSQSGCNIWFKHTDDNKVKIGGSIFGQSYSYFCHSISDRNDLIQKFINGKLSVLPMHDDKKAASEALQQQITDRWNSL